MAGHHQDQGAIPQPVPAVPPGPVQQVLKLGGGQV